MRDVQIGDTVCCCDLKHRVIADIEEGDAEMTDGWVGSIGAGCVEPVQPDGSCHTAYEDVEDNQPS